MKTLTIELDNSPTFVGREAGQAMRAQLELDQKENDVEIVKVIIPSTIYTMSSSFFMGLFGPSVRKCGGHVQFGNKFHFAAPDFLQPILYGYAMRAAQDRTVMTAINVREFSDQEITLLNQCLGTLLKQMGDKAHLGKDPIVPLFDDQELCRLRYKIAPHIGVSETLDQLNEQRYLKEMV